MVLVGRSIQLYSECQFHGTTSSNNYMKILVFRAVLPILLILFGINCAAAEGAALFTDKDFGFSVSVPKGFSAFPGAQKGVRVVMTTPSGGFPNCNVVAEPISVEINEERLNPLVSDILEDYRRIGIADAAVIKSSIINGDHGSYLEAILAYRTSDTELRSLVGIISGADRHFIVTCVDKAGEFDRIESDFKSLPASFSVMGAIPDTQNVQHTVNPLIIILLVSILIVVLWGLTRFYTGR